MTRRLVALATAAAFAVGCAPAEGRNLDDQQLSELERLVHETSELVDHTERELEGTRPES
jgi:hypothetical protein